MLPLWDTQKHHRAPVVTTLLIAGCMAVFVYEISLTLGGASGAEAWLTRHALVPGRLLDGWADPAQWQTVLTSMFLHGGWGHLLGNCWFLWVFGNNVEDRLGHIAYPFFYVACGAAAALAQVISAPGSATPMVGASGAISGVLGAYLVFYPRAWVVALVPWIVPVVPIPAVVFLVLWFLMQAWMGLGELVSGTAEGGGVAWWAHAGGFAAGFVLALGAPRGKR